MLPRFVVLLFYTFRCFCSIVIKSAPDLNAFPDLAGSLLFGPLLSSQFRLQGHGSKPGAKAVYLKVNGGKVDGIRDLSNEQLNQLKALAGALKENTGCGRYYDTELKYICNFLDQYYDLGDHFTITFESSLDACGSCRRYIQALQNLAQKDGKLIEIKFVAHPQAPNPQLRNFLNLAPLPPL